MDSTWRRSSDWKSRYSQLYSCRRISTPKEDDIRHISFMSNESTPYTSLLTRLHSNRRGSLSPPNLNNSGLVSPEYTQSILSPRCQPCSSFGFRSMQSDDLGGHETSLLEMVRARSREVEDEVHDHPLDIPRDDISEDMSNEPCVHGLNLRYTERSVSRSRVSRMSTRRDMDIPSILAFTTTTPAPIQIEIPAFQKAKAQQRPEIPRWSIRRSVCPVCSQKWKDRSNITRIKYSGLKRNSLSELPSVIAPARLRTSIMLEYVPRRDLTADREMSSGGLRNTSASWQLTRARRFRTPKPQVPPPEATAPPSSTAPLARRDLDYRVTRFLTDSIE